MATDFIYKIMTKLGFVWIKKDVKRGSDILGIGSIDQYGWRKFNPRTMEKSTGGRFTFWKR